MSSSRSLMKAFNEAGPSTILWGTPQAAHLQLDSAPLVVTLRSLPINQFSIHLTVCSPILRFQSFVTRMLWHTASDALLESRCTSFTAVPSSTRRVMTSRNPVRLLKRDFSFGESMLTTSNGLLSFQLLGHSILKARALTSLSRGSLVFLVPMSYLKKTFMLSLISLTRFNSIWALAFQVASLQTQTPVEYPSQVTGLIMHIVKTIFFPLEFLHECHACPC